MINPTTSRTAMHNPAYPTTQNAPTAKQPHRFAPMHVTVYSGPMWKLT
jgi:hypothetical protein